MKRYCNDEFFTGVTAYEEGIPPLPALFRGAKGHLQKADVVLYYSYRHTQQWTVNYDEMWLKIYEIASALQNRKRDCVMHILRPIIFPVGYILKSAHLSDSSVAHVSACYYFLWRFYRSLYGKTNHGFLWDVKPTALSIKPTALSIIHGSNKAEHNMKTNDQRE